MCGSSLLRAHVAVASFPRHCSLPSCRNGPSVSWTFSLLFLFPRHRPRLHCGSCRVRLVRVGEGWMGRSMAPSGWFVGLKHTHTPMDGPATLEGSDVSFVGSGPRGCATGRVRDRIDWYEEPNRKKTTHRGRRGGTRGIPGEMELTCGWMGRGNPALREKWNGANAFPSWNAQAPQGGGTDRPTYRFTY